MSLVGICHTCKDNETKSQIKAGCGCLVHICDDCRDEQAHVAHSKCVVCKGGKTPNQVMQEECDNYNASLGGRCRPAYDIFFDEDDTMYDDLDSPISYTNVHDDPYDDLSMDDYPFG